MITINDIPENLQVEGLVIYNGQQLDLHLSKKTMESLVPIFLPVIERKEREALKESA